MRKILILLAAGSGSRMKTDINKIFLDVAGKSIFSRSLYAFLSFADKIVVVENGSISEIGSHDELMVNGGFYSRLYASYTEE